MQETISFALFFVIQDIHERPSEVKKKNSWKLLKWLPIERFLKCISLMKYRILYFHSEGFVCSTALQVRTCIVQHPLPCTPMRREIVVLLNYRVVDLTIPHQQGYLNIYLPILGFNLLILISVFCWVEFPNLTRVSFVFFISFSIGRSSLFSYKNCYELLKLFSLKIKKWWPIS